MEDVDSRQSALASIKNKAEELIKQAGDKEDTAVQGMETVNVGGIGREGNIFGEIFRLLKLILIPLCSGLY
jgi:hypothetical protein